MAIAFDAASSAATTTWAHTCAANATFLYVVLKITASGQSATYNGVSMTPGPGTGNIVTFYLFNPSAGTNNIVITGGSTIVGAAASYTGSVTTGLNANSSAADNANISAHTSSITTTLDNCWTIAGYNADNSGSQTAGALTTQRVLQLGPGNTTLGIYDSGGPKTPAGSFTFTVNLTGVAGTASHWGKLSLAPAADNTSLFFALMD